MEVSNESGDLEQLLLKTSTDKDSAVRSGPLAEKLTVIQEALHTCFGCKSVIKDNKLVRLGNNTVWHSNCLVCCECKCSLVDNRNCYLKNDQIYCKSDYIRIVGVKCVKCEGKFKINDKVRTANGKHFHKDCFVCTVCNTNPKVGEEFAFGNNQLYCKADIPQSKDASKFQRLFLNESCEIETVHPDGAHTIDEVPDEGNDSHSKEDEGLLKEHKNKPEKKPRQRTVLTEEQLAILRHYYYNVDRKPSTPLKEEICKKTSLTMRVVRVWFQNRRCKEKKERVREAGIRQLDSEHLGQTTFTSCCAPYNPSGPLTIWTSTPVHPQVHLDFQGPSYPQQPFYGGINQAYFPTQPSSYTPPPIVNHVVPQPSFPCASPPEAASPSTPPFVMREGPYMTDHQGSYVNGNEIHYRPPMDTAAQQPIGY